MRTKSLKKDPSGGEGSEKGHGGKGHRFNQLNEADRSIEKMSKAWWVEKTTEKKLSGQSV